MLRNQWIVIFGLLCFASIIALVLFFSGGSALAVIGVIGGGMVMLFVGMDMSVTSTLGRPIPFKDLRRSQEFILVKRMESSFAFVNIPGEGSQMRLVEGVPIDIEEGEIFIPKKNGSIAIVARHVKEEEKRR